MTVRANRLKTATYSLTYNFGVKLDRKNKN